MIKETIVAQATPVGKSGISIVRISGKNALEISRHIFFSDKLSKQIEPNYLYLGQIDLGQTKDKGFFVYFKKPNSFTGEDVVEFQCHGGMLIAQKIIEMCLKFGARLAEAGEFSKRAFLNGKMTLDQAEGIVDSINAETESQLKAGNELMNGNLFKTVSNLQQNLTDLLAEIEVNLDYPEHDIEYKTKENIFKTIKKINIEISNLLKTEEAGKIIKNGINIAIVGKTNVGKSSLMNALLNKEQAIVTDIEGTTRDVLNGAVEYKGIKLNFFDTAGLRQTDDKIEKIGIEKAKQALENCDIVLLVLDISKESTSQDIENINLIKNKKSIIVLNKSDLPEKLKIDLPTIKISAYKKTNIELLKNKIYELSLEGSNINQKFVLTNARHIEILKESQQIIKNSTNNFDNLTLDLIALDIKQLWEKLGEITGETANEEIIDKIFSKFCLGK